MLNVRKKHINKFIKVISKFDFKMKNTGECTCFALSFFCLDTKERNKEKVKAYFNHLDFLKILLLTRPKPSRHAFVSGWRDSWVSTRQPAARRIFENTTVVKIGQ